MASASVDESTNTGNESHSTLRIESCEKQPVSEPRKNSPEARSAVGKKSRKHQLSPKQKASKRNHKRLIRSKFVYTSESSSETSSSSDSEDSSSTASSAAVYERENSGQSFRVTENDG